MPYIDIVLNLLTLGGYLLATLLLISRVRLQDHLQGHSQDQENDEHTIRLRARLAAGVGIAAHTTLLFTTLFPGQGLALNFFTTLSLFAWQAVVVFGFATLRYRVDNLGLVLFPLAAIAQAIDAVIITLSVPIEAPIGLQLHILFSMMSIGLLTVAASQALLISIQHHRLRTRRLGGIMKTLPALETMEALLFQLLVCGWVVLSLALLSGIPHIHDILAQKLLHKTALTITAWLMFSVLLLGHYRLGWRGKTVLRAVWLGYALLLVAYFGSRIVTEFLL